MINFPVFFYFDVWFIPYLFSLSGGLGRLSIALQEIQASAERSSQVMKNVLTLWRYWVELFYFIKNNERKILEKI